MAKNITWYLLCCVSFCLPLANSVANTVTLDFDDPFLAPGQFFLDGELVLNEPVQLGTIGASGAVDILNPGSGYTGGVVNGTNYLHSSIYSMVFLQAATGESFDLLSLSIGEYSSYSSTPSVEITGYLENGSEISSIINLDGLFDGLGGIDDFQLVQFDVGWKGLTRVEFDDSAYSLDDIQIFMTPVPIPGALFLFMNGLLGMLFLRFFSKKQRV
jgi:hypothetical protein